jgi:hypothetical protein
LRQDEEIQNKNTKHYVFDATIRKETHFDSFAKAVSEEKIFLEINQSETRIVYNEHFVNGSGRNEQTL